MKEMVEKLVMIHVFDTISAIDTTIKVARGRYESGEPYVDFHQIDGKHSTIEEFTAAWDKKGNELQINNFFAVKPKDAVKIIDALRDILKGDE